VTDPAGNPMSAPFTGQFTVALPDLALDPADPSSLVVPSSALFGQSIPISWIVDNLGTAPAADGWSDRV